MTGARDHARQHTACAAAAAGVTLQCVGCFLEKRCALSGMRRARDVGCLAVPSYSCRHNYLHPTRRVKAAPHFQPHQATNDKQQQLKTPQHKTRPRTAYTQTFYAWWLLKTPCLQPVQDSLPAPARISGAPSSSALGPTQPAVLSRAWCPTECAAVGVATFLVLITRTPFD